MNCLGSGTIPLTSAPEKSKPGFSSWNLSSSIFFCTSFCVSGSRVLWPLQAWDHVSALKTFCSYMCSSSSSIIQ